MSRRVRTWQSFDCVSCGGTGEVDYRTYATGAVTLEMNYRNKDGSFGDRGVSCRDCDGTGKRWRPADACDHDWEYDPWEYGGRTCKKCGDWEGSGGRR